MNAIHVVKKFPLLQYQQVDETCENPQEVGETFGDTDVEDDESLCRHLSPVVCFPLQVQTQKVDGEIQETEGE